MGIAYMDSSHQASVNCIQFCPWEFGLMLACASSNGFVSMLSYGADHQWQRSSFAAHPSGVRSVSWAPGGEPRLASAGNDNAAYIWRREGESWVKDHPALPVKHTDAVRDIAWRPDTPSTLATGSWDKTVGVWTQDVEGQGWRLVTQLTMAGGV